MLNNPNYKHTSNHCLELDDNTNQCNFGGECIYLNDYIAEKKCELYVNGLVEEIICMGCKL